MDEEDYFKLVQILDLDHDKVLFKFHRRLCDLMGDDCLKLSLDSAEKQFTLTQKKLEHQGAMRLHAMFERELEKIKKKTQKIE